MSGHSATVNSLDKKEGPGRNGRSMDAKLVNSQTAKRPDAAFEKKKESPEPLPQKGEQQKKGRLADKAA